MTKYNYDALTNTKVAMTPEEEAAFDAKLKAENDAKAVVVEQVKAREDEVAAKKASAHTKLKDLGLTDEEIAAM
jgi:hypothetical protein